MMTNYREVLWIVLAIIFGFSWLVHLALGSGHGRRVHESEAPATEYGGVVREGQGGMTFFLWTAFIAIAAWSIFYLTDHWSEFAPLFGK